MAVRRTVKKSIGEMLESWQKRSYPMAEEIRHELKVEKALRWMLTVVFGVCSAVLLFEFLYLGIEEGNLFGARGENAAFLLFPAFCCPYFLSLLYRQMKKARSLRITPLGIETRLSVWKRRIPYEKVHRVLLKDTSRGASRRYRGGSVCKTTAYYLSRRGRRLFSFSFAPNMGYQRSDGLDMRLDDILFAQPARTLCEQLECVLKLSKKEK